MPKATLEERVDQLRQLRHQELDDGAVSLLRKSLRDRSNLLVAEAAKVIAARRLDTLAEELLSAFDRLFGNAAKVDPKCWGKTAIIRALSELDYESSAPFLLGMRTKRLLARGRNRSGGASTPCRYAGDSIARRTGPPGA